MTSSFEHANAHPNSSLAYTQKGLIWRFWLAFWHAKEINKHKKYIKITRDISYDISDSWLYYFQYYDLKSINKGSNETHFYFSKDSFLSTNFLP